MDTPSFKEDHISQIPALQMLQKLGYEYLSPAATERPRKQKKGMIQQLLTGKKRLKIEYQNYGL